MSESILGDLKPPFDCKIDSDNCVHIVDATGFWILTMGVVPILNAIPSLEAERDALRLRVKELEVLAKRIAWQFGVHGKQGNVLTMSHNNHPLARLAFSAMGWASVHQEEIAALKENPLESIVDTGLTGHEPKENPNG